MTFASAELASTYLALDFWGSQNSKSFSTLRCQGVSVKKNSLRVFRKKFPRGPGDGFCDFVCFRTSKISGYFRELNKSGVEVYKSPGCFAALRRYPCLRVQSSYTEWLHGAQSNSDSLKTVATFRHTWL